MAVDSMLPSPSSISNPMSGFEGLPGKRRKKRTSIETNVRVILERNFNTVQQALFSSIEFTEKIYSVRVAFTQIYHIARMILKYSRLHFPELSSKI